MPRTERVLTPAQISALPYRPCVGVMLVNRSGAVFAGQRLDSTAEAWQMPQGGIDPGEEPMRAALRELVEETGIAEASVSVVTQTADWITYDLPHDLVPKIWKGRYRGQRQLWFLMRFLGTDAEVNIRTSHPEFRAWRWIAPDELLERIVPFKRATYATVIEAFRSHLD